ncbi:MAG: hypothetical protein A2725_02750 [Candidatus Magasanikbacteria bacterium RIFCSPHIGHO2_01_FULL_33_34]|uniref:Glycosyl transferase family 1 domain-containing protein n=1 Tax=Candidatus Magasanikbacteria bacterium RIFCSPHIGHO2_01_FULL_33_34 TaxID=1798671 RepID=A0A1F6LGY5_9BACT|nr:MAG: hypothetical protein A2725_02750 [Candidatus Magasanikbacteria bacterium RIFCSPHIGHO2_01_FULL_33_34]OGH66055.1 MAG: hypothetical protein A3B83_00240 [Candidatus Magasanikbacteria bacterium RIFCSPHIGHO2_02_FULL_33_17]OGH75901.1 MAG: hypothetical protein A3A89_00150 [Candidatus Magasanikbacteria bacterium RIFCSPLOWO2_01_FULL_33_34]OGH81678.1 MAG: hypothetical protein A3F93_01945 [Candidatus Magasanikbacteria bacterium RIFCSPLOWO2_12_FULL_34_7]
MRIGIDARMMGGGFGIGRYVEQLILSLQKIDNNNQYILFVKKIDNNKFKSKNFKQVEADISWYSWAEQIKLNKIIKREKVDLMHFPHWNIPLFYNGLYIVTIHDLIMFHFPRPEATTLGPIKFWLKDFVHRIVIRNAVKKAKHIITTSEFTKDDINKTLGVSMNKMATIYQAPFTTINNLQFTINNDVVLSKHNIVKPYALYVGSAYPHKNLDSLLKAWKLFLDKYEVDCQLVLVGKESYFYNNIKESDIANRLGNRVIFTGFVDDFDLDLLYKQSKLYIFPSLYEGFGLPPLEAIARGLPVVSSSSSCLPEVLGEGALYFDPNNIENIADTINEGLYNEDIRHQLLINGRTELQKYSSEKMAIDTLEIYKKNCG